MAWKMRRQKDQKSANDLGGLLFATNIGTQAPQHRISIPEVWNTSNFFNQL